MYELFRTSTPYETSILNGRNGLRSVVVVWDKEPEGDLPVNVLWLFGNPRHPKHLNLYRRTSMQPNNGMRNTWEPVNTYESVWEMQNYAAPPAPISFSLATTDILGLTILSYPADQEIAKVVVDSDVRLSDARVPIEHQHLEKPASELATSTGSVEYYGTFSSPSVLRSPDSTQFSYSQIAFSEVTNRP